MTKKTLNLLIKKASRKNSAVAKAMEAAAKLGKPTTSGLVAGAGLGSILAAAGALSREGEPEENNSIFSNPLLLGALGATGGYLAGNAFDKTPVTPSRRNNGLSLSSLALLGGGVGTIGSRIAAEDIMDKLHTTGSNYDKALGQVPRSLLDRLQVRNDNELKKIDLKSVKDSELVKAIRQRARASGKPISSDVARTLAQSIRNDYRVAQNEYARALREAGKVEDALFMGENFYGYGNKRPEKLGLKALEKLRFSKYSPVRWAKALNPLKGGKLIEQLTRTAVRNPKTTAIAALAALAGGGKAIYDKTR